MIMKKFDLKDTPAPSACDDTDTDASIESVNTDPCDDTTEDTPDASQIFLSLCSVMLAELNRANAKYPERFASSAEGLGVLRGEYLKVEDLLKRVKVVGSKTFSSDFDLLSNELFTACIQLTVVTSKAIMSFCDTKPIAEKFSHALKQQQQAAELLRGEEADEPAV
jgi:hypothetical protein